MAHENNPGDNEIRDLLQTMKTIAVVGLSSNPSKASHQVAKYMMDNGYKIIPINPGIDEFYGEKSYPELKAVPDPIDIVDVFRRPEHVPGVADEAIEVGAKALWLQLDVVHEEAAQKARDAGLTVVQDACILQEHKRLL